METGELLYKEDLGKNRHLKSEKRQEKMIYLLLFVTSIILFLTATDSLFYYQTRGAALVLIFIGVMSFLLGMYLRRNFLRIRPLEVYENGFIWPYYNWPTDDGFVRWQDVRTIVINSREIPSSFFISVKNKKLRFAQLSKRTVYDIERFLDVARSKGVEVIEDELSFRELEELLENDVSKKSISREVKSQSKAIYENREYYRTVLARFVVRTVIITVMFIPFVLFVLYIIIEAMLLSSFVGVVAELMLVAFTMFFLYYLVIYKWTYEDTLVKTPKRVIREGTKIRIDTMKRTYEIDLNDVVMLGRAPYWRIKTKDGTIYEFYAVHHTITDPILSIWKNLSKETD